MLRFEKLYTAELVTSAPALLHLYRFIPCSKMRRSMETLAINPGSYCIMPETKKKHEDSNGCIENPSDIGLNIHFFTVSSTKL